MKKRLDVTIFERGLTESRERAKALIMEGIVYVNGQKQDKAGTQIKESDKIEIRGNTLRYVSRGGLKLEKALEVFPIDVKGKTALDIGASSGGFTDCLLQNGVAKVYSVDVGYGQLAYKLRCDERVVVYEKTNFRYLDPEEFAEKVDLVVMDVSFISILKLAQNIKRFMTEQAQAVFLIKPQFEAQKADVGKNGVISSEKMHRQIVFNTVISLSEMGFYLAGIDYSPIKGPKGNIEFISYYTQSKENMIDNIQDAVDACVTRAHKEL